MKNIFWFYYIYLFHFCNKDAAFIQGQGTSSSSSSSTSTTGAQPPQQNDSGKSNNMDSTESTPNLTHATRVSPATVRAKPPYNISPSFAALMSGGKCSILFFLLLFVVPFLKVPYLRPFFLSV